MKCYFHSRMVLINFFLTYNRVCNGGGYVDCCITNVCCILSIVLEAFGKVQRMNPWDIVMSALRLKYVEIISENFSKFFTTGRRHVLAGEII